VSYEYEDGSSLDYSVEVPKEISSDTESEEGKLLENVIKKFAEEGELLRGGHHVVAEGTNTPLLTAEMGVQYSYLAFLATGALGLCAAYYLMGRSRGKAEGLTSQTSTY